MSRREKRRVTYLYKSYPAAKADPRVGNFAFSERRLMRRFEVGAISDFMFVFSVAVAVAEEGAGDILRFLSTCSVEAESVVMYVKALEPQ